MKDPTLLIVENLLQRLRLTDLEERAIERLITIYKRYYRYTSPRRLEDWE